MEAYLEVIHADGRTDRRVVAGERVVVGRAPRDGIALPEAGELEPEHLQVTPRGDGCWVAIARGARVPALQGGKPFESGLVAWGGEIAVGSLRLRFADRLPPERKPAAVGSPMVLVALVLLPAAAWMLLTSPAMEVAVPKPVAPPELFDKAKPCPEAGDGALARAREAAEAAAAKAERYPFEAQDGIQAVALYGLAASCWRGAGRGEEANRMEREREGWMRRIDEEFKTRRLRLARALKHKRDTDSLVETRALLRFVEHRADKYTAWLKQLDRHLRLRLEIAAKKANK